MTAQSSDPTDTSIRSLAETYFSVVGGFVEPGQPYALVDYPSYHNVGDSAIYAGQMAFFDKHVGRSPDYVCSIGTYRSDIAKFCPEGPIFICGGGNFGDIWPAHQNFRKRLLKSYPDRPIIQLGQSIHFADAGARDETARAIADHGNFTLLVRDKPSFELAQKHFDCAVIMSPDGAHNLLRLHTEETPNHKVFSMIRADREQRGDGVAEYLETLGPVTDWQRQFWSRSPFDRVIERTVDRMFPDSRMLMTRRERMYRRQTWNRIRYGVKLLSQGEILVSDRLHVHIMASLMRKPHISLDNSYGKITRYIEAWGEDDLVTRVSGLDALKDALRKAGHETAS